MRNQRRPSFVFLTVTAFFVFATAAIAQQQPAPLKVANIKR